MSGLFISERKTKAMSKGSREERKPKKPVEKTNASAPSMKAGADTSKAGGAKKK